MVEACVQLLRLIQEQTSICKTSQEPSYIATEFKLFYEVVGLWDRDLVSINGNVAFWGSIT